MASTRNAVTRTLGSSKTICRARATLTHPALCAGSPLSRTAGEGAERSEAGEGTPLDLGCDNLVPELGIFFLVGRPDLFLCDLAESLDIGGIDGHPLGFEQLCRLLGGVDAFGQPTNSLLGRPRGIEQQLLLLWRETVEHLQVHHQRRRPVIMVG